MGISIQEEDAVVADLIQSFNVNNMILFVGTGPLSEELSAEVCQLPWSCVITTNQEEGFCKYFEKDGRRLKEYNSAGELPLKLFNRSQLPVIRCFGAGAGEEAEEDPELLRERQQDECKTILAAVMAKLDVVSQMVMVGYRPGEENELKRTSLVVQWGKCQGGSISLFGMDPEDEETAKLLKSADKMNFRHFRQTLAQMLGRRGTEDIPEAKEDPDAAMRLFYKGRKPAFLPQSQLLRYRNAGELLTEEKVYEIRPLGRIQQARWFANFLTRTAVYGPQWYGYLPQSEFYLKREYGTVLTELVSNILDGKEMAGYGYATPIILNGDPGSSKSIVLGFLAFQIFEKKMNPVIFITKKELNINEDLEELDSMMQTVEAAGEADTRILVIWDGSAYHNIEKNAKNIARQLDNRGRRFVLVCSAYRNLALEKAGPDEVRRFGWEKERGFEERSDGRPAAVSYYNGCYFVNSNRWINSREEYELMNKIRRYCPQNSDHIKRKWEKLKETPDASLFDYFYELIVALQPPLEQGLGDEQRIVFRYVQEQMKDYTGEPADETEEKTLSPIQKALQDAGFTLDEEEDAEKKEDRALENLGRLNDCVALFGRFKLDTPVSLALYLLYEGNAGQAELFYSDSKRELFKIVTSSIPWIFYRENEDGEFCFYYRSVKEAEIHLKNNAIEPDKTIGMVLQMLDYYIYSYRQYGSQDPFLKRTLQRLIRILGPNSDYEKFQDQGNMEHNLLLKNMDRIIDKLAYMREEIGMEDADASFASIEITFLREYFGNNWSRIVHGCFAGENELGGLECWDVYGDIFTEETYCTRLKQLKKAVDLANANIDMLERSDVDYGSRRQVASQINSLTVELCRCNMSLEKLLNEYFRLCRAKGLQARIDRSIYNPLPYRPMYQMLTKALNSDPLNGYIYNALFDLFEKEYQGADGEEKRIALLSEIMMYVDDALGSDIQDRGPASVDELGQHLARIRQYGSAARVGIRSILEGSCSPSFSSLFQKMLEQNNASAITFVAQQELESCRLNRAGRDPDDEASELTEGQLEKCREIYDFLSKKEYAECVERNSHALYLLLRVAWMCYNRRPLSDNGQERRMTRLDKGQWEDIRRICCLYEECTNSNRRPIVVLVHALSVVQLSGDYREAADMLVSLNEEAFYATPRMRVPYMICDSDGCPAAYSGKVIDARERFKGFIKVDGLPLYLGNKKGVRFYLNNLGNRKMPEENEYLTGLEMGIGYMGFSLYTPEGRKRLEGRQ